MNTKFAALLVSTSVAVVLFVSPPMRSVSPVTARAGPGQRTWPSSKRGKSCRSFTATGLFLKPASGKNAIAAKRTAAVTPASQPLRSANRQLTLTSKRQLLLGASILAERRNAGYAAVVRRRRQLRLANQLITRSAVEEVRFWPNADVADWPSHTSAKRGEADVPRARTARPSGTRRQTQVRAPGVSSRDQDRRGTREGRREVTDAVPSGTRQSA